MKKVETIKQTWGQDETVVVSEGSAGALSIAGIYEDGFTRDWANQFCLRAARVAGESAVQKAWYDVKSLNDPALLIDAVGAAVKADVVVVSVHAAVELPLELSLWIEMWLPRRRPRPGALAALIGVTEPSDSHSVRTLDYFNAVARMSQLEFISQTRLRPAHGASGAELPMPARKVAHSLAEIYGQRLDNYFID